MPSNGSAAMAPASEKRLLSLSAAGHGNASSGVDLAIRALMAESGRYFPEATETPRILSMAVERRRLSEIARVEVGLGASTGTIYVKVHRNPNAPPSRVHRKARLEFETLGLLHERFQDVPGCAVVRPIAFFPEHLAVVTEAVAGENLHRLLKRTVAAWRGRANQAMASEHCRRAGVWLRHFQAITDQGLQEPLPFGLLVEWIEADVGRCAKLGLAAGAGTGLVECAHACVAAIGARRFPVVGQHPDFQPDNVLVTASGVTVLDFTSFQHGAPFSDLARFVASLAFLGKSPIYPRRRLRALADAFRGGYGDGGAEGEPAMVLYMIHHMVRTARMVSAWPRPPLVKRLVERRTMRFLAGWWHTLSQTGDALVDLVRSHHASPRSEPPTRREIRQ